MSQCVGEGAELSEQVGVQSHGVGKIVIKLIFNPRRACAARVTVLAVSLCVCLSVTTLEEAWRNSALKLRYD